MLQGNLSFMRRTTLGSRAGSDGVCFENLEVKRAYYDRYSGVIVSRVIENARFL